MAGFRLDNTIEVDTAAIERELALLDYVSDVSVAKAYPNKIVINIKERMPVAYSMQAGNLVAITSDGYPLPVDSRLGAPTMPLFYGEIASQDGSSDLGGVFPKYAGNPGNYTGGIAAALCAD